MKRIKNEKGNVSILMVMGMIVVMGFSGLAIDMGMVYSERMKLIDSLDAAVLAGAQELPASEQKAIQIATAYLAANEVDLNDTLVTVLNQGYQLEIQSTKDVPLYFMRIFGITETSVSAHSKAMVGIAGSVKGGIRPFAVEDFPYAYGTLITLKQGAGSSYNGNFGVVALGGTGASVYEENALYGYAGEIKVGQYIYTETGNMAGVSNTLQQYINNIPHTFENHPRSSDRVWTVPLIDSLEVSGRDDVLVTGFAQVFVENIDRRSGKIEINARFLRFVVNGEIDSTLEDKGVYSVKLVN